MNVHTCSTCVFSTMWNYKSQPCAGCVKHSHWQDKPTPKSEQNKIKRRKK